MTFLDSVFHLRHPHRFHRRYRRARTRPCHRRRPRRRAFGKRNRSCAATVKTAKPSASSRFPGSMALAIGYTSSSWAGSSSTRSPSPPATCTPWARMAAIGGHFDIVAIQQPAVDHRCNLPRSPSWRWVSGGIERSQQGHDAGSVLPVRGPRHLHCVPARRKRRLSTSSRSIPRALPNPMVWIFAFSQAFFSPVRRGQRLRHLWLLPRMKTCRLHAQKTFAIFDTLAALLAAVRYHPRHGSGRRSAGRAAAQPHVRLAGPTFSTVCPAAGSSASSSSSAFCSPASAPSSTCSEAPVATCRNNTEAESAFRLLPSSLSLAA